MKVFKLALICVSVAVVGGAIGSYGQSLKGEYDFRYDVVTANDSYNKGGVYWHENDVSEDLKNKTHTVKDATGTVFKNVPLSISDEDFIKHFGSRKEWANHAFFGLTFSRPVNLDNVDKDIPLPTTCESWQDILSSKMNAFDSWKVSDEVYDLRNEYLRQCAWNKSKDMSYKDEQATTMYKAGEAMQIGWFALFALLGCIPALWVSFWRGVGMAVRTAKNEAFKKGGE